MRARSTYRVQLTPDFGFDQLAEVVPYLARLGVTHVYCSPYLQAAPGSTHGYDVVDHSRVNVELGGEEALDRLHEVLRQHGLGQVIDLVPNHMSVGTPENRQWWDVLRRGRSSRFADWFDIDWGSLGEVDPDHGEVTDKVLVPVLGDRYGRELESGSITLVEESGSTLVAYHGHRFPLSPESEAQLAAEGKPPDPIDPEWMHRLLAAQHYRLSYWRTGGDDLNYRRFFDVNTLAGVRAEMPEVFASGHRLPLQWLRHGVVDGFRIDHPDGLRDPAGYLRMLRDQAPEAWIVVEKVLEPDETLPGDWPCEGTTGYDFLALAGRLFVPPEAREAMTAVCDELGGGIADFRDEVAACKRLVLDEVVASDVARVVRVAVKLCAGHVLTADFSHREVHSAVDAMLAAFPVYRTYVDASGECSDTDRLVIDGVLDDVIAGGVDADLATVLCGALRGDDQSDRAVSFRARFQQLSGPVMAKSVEDTAFYRDVRLVSLNEVGGDPGAWGATVDELHRHNERIARRWPGTMLAGSTHDTKRSEDVRARISLLAEQPDAWRAAVVGWQAANESKWGSAEPDRTMELLLYQTMVGAHSLDRDRAAQYMHKAAREAKVRTSWLAPDDGYEASLQAFVHAVFDDRDVITSIAAFCEPLLVPGRLAGLSLLTLRMSCPGVPDTFQGCELFTSSLVDPDNRRPVDFGVRAELLAEVLAADSPPPAEDDRSKLWLTHRLLAVRAMFPEAFAGPAATYTALAAGGSMGEATVAFVRGRTVVVAATTRPLRLHREGWGDTSIYLPPGSWRNAVEGATVEGAADLADHAARYGIAVFTATPETQR